LPGTSPQKLFSGASLLRAETMSVPGATTSGLIRRSSVGPRLLNAATHCGSPDTRAFAIGSSGKSSRQISP
jgi:hypothetical protein